MRYLLRFYRYTELVFEFLAYSFMLWLDLCLGCVTAGSILEKIEFRFAATIVSIMYRIAETYTGEQREILTDKAKMAEHAYKSFSRQ